ncbi:MULTISPECIES: hypothetical protein [unclassified Moorena]|uniref:hypothetical protein n=1 Tax=unclassified Moorena TaxID=2683338 RepID=UPI0010FA8FB4|nr:MULTISPECIES: hypothetical protein [unclassified Moorena]NEQ05284.1 hypothetical protein [Moorena sp. SIO4E2]NEQ15810.1 hypothetical protein [Moorena sp. SIO3E2]NER86115.1 hypothetical protein [Moorena sp. SIO3A2]NET62891.1 hypothetical protein [Moorena sp. SIO1G6]
MIINKQDKEEYRKCGRSVASMVSVVSVVSVGSQISNWRRNVSLCATRTLHRTAFSHSRSVAKADG